MKNFVKNCFFFSLILIVIVLSLYVFVPSKTNNICYAVWKKKSLMNGKESPRLILLGGSNVAMGYDSSILKDSLKCDVVNMSGFMNMGMNLIIDNVYEFVRPGDIILLQPEYDQFFTCYDGSPDERVGAVFLKFDHFRNLTQYDFGQITEFILGIPSAILYNIVDQRSYTSADSIYNSFGDEMLNRTDTMHYSIQPNIIGKHVRLRYINKFEKQIKDLRAKGAHVIVSPCFYHKSAFNVNRSEIKKIELEFHKRRIPFYTRPESNCFSDEYYFNAVYHLNREGTIKYTNNLIKFLQSAEYFE